MTLRPLAIALASGTAALALITPASAAERECAQSPGKVIELCAWVDNGRALYEVSRKGVVVLAPAELGLTFQGEVAARFTAIGNPRRTASNTTWEQPWGEQRLIRDNHSELTVTLSGDTALNKAVDVTFRLFDDGFGFRYTFGGIPAGQSVAVTAERTQFHPVGAYQAWWYEALGSRRDEYVYSQTDARRITLAETPLTLKGESGLYLSFHEAAMIDFPSMLLQGNGAGTLTAWLMPLPDGILAKKTGAFSTPWRTVLIGESPAALADSRIELNLNAPNKLGDVSYVKPMKYVGIWWQMHLRTATWKSGPLHAATTANTKKYIDFAAKYGFGGVLVEGWNVGWDGNQVTESDKINFTTSYPDFDIAEVTAYAKSKGVQLIGHHETRGNVMNYRRQIDDAMKFYQRYGVTALKSGYVRDSGDIPDGEGNGHWFADQFMVNQIQHDAEIAAKYGIAVDAHEPVKDTGLRRTWPNMISREAARGQEYNAVWSNPTSPPEHLTILPFTRMLSGPMDYTPGIFDLTFGQSEVTRRIQSTLATQLAAYVVLYSPVQMAADLLENYEKNLPAFQFIRDVPVDWETSKTLQSEIGDYVMVARQQRGGKDWYLGAITDENARTLTQSLDFLTPGRRYEAQIYRDGPGADYRTNPTAITIEKKVVTSKDALTLALAPGGGTAIRFKRLD